MKKLTVFLAAILLAPNLANAKTPGDITGIFLDDSKLASWLRRQGSIQSVDDYRQSFCKNILKRHGQNGVYFDTDSKIRNLIYCENRFSSGSYRDRSGALVSLQNDWCRRWADGTTECLAGTDADQLGKPKITGWAIKNYPEQRKVKYKAPANFYRVNVRGVYGRYYETKYIVRAFEPGHSGTPGIYSMTGRYETSCSSYATYVSCTTKPPAFSFTPGLRPKPSEIVQFTKRIIYDCEENTYAVFLDGQMTSSWKKDSRVKEGNAYMCQRVSVLLDSDFYGLAGGSPTSADIKWQ